MNSTDPLPPGPPEIATVQLPAASLGEDELLKFLQETHQQQYATFFNKKQALGQLLAIDEIFVQRLAESEERDQGAA
jgi:hypothetical protein